jgi:hypothetical protein
MTVVLPVTGPMAFTGALMFAAPLRTLPKLTVVSAKPVIATIIIRISVIAVIGVPVIVITIRRVIIITITAIIPRTTRQYKPNAEGYSRKENHLSIH